MKIKKVIIDNFKSIDHLELDFDKVGDSYTKIFVGINESGKSNILEALSYFKVPEEGASFDHFCNQKLEDRDECMICFDLVMDKDVTLSFHDYRGKKYEQIIPLLNLKKKVYLSRTSNRFKSSYEYTIGPFATDLYVKKLNNQVRGVGTVTTIVSKEEKDSTCVLLSADYINKNYRSDIDNFIKKVEPVVSQWKPSQEYMLSSVNLNDFAKNIENNKPLRNIFYLSGYSSMDSIYKVITKVSNAKQRSILSSKLNKAINNYVNKAWSNKINIVIEIAPDGALSFLIRDQGAENEHDRFEISERSQGAQQFLSLVLSLSLEAESHERKNEIILIDEPEVHLHPSGIRDLSRELLKVGHENYVFLATHSPFIIDRQHKERHYIVKKNSKAITEVTRIKETDDIVDEEVLNDAFGINVYRDLLNPHSLLVEGSTDKVLLKKAFTYLNRDNISITNGCGANIETLASKMNFDDISVLVITDDDKDGQKYKEQILKIGGVYNSGNVFTIRDLEGTIVSEGTIEDTLSAGYVQSKFQELYTEQFGKSPLGFNLAEDKPFMFQIIVYLKNNGNYNKFFIDELKKKLSDDFNPRKNAFNKDFPLLKSLAEKIIEKLK